MLTKRIRRSAPAQIVLLFLTVLSVALAPSCSTGEADQASGGSAGRSPRQGAGHPGGPGGSGAGAWSKAAAAAVPVEVAPVQRRPISSFIESNCTLEAENEVDLVARIAGPITELNVEEGDKVKKGELLAKIDDRELRATAEISRVALEEARQAWERSKKLVDQSMISPEEWDQAVSKYESAKAEYDAALIQLGYTEIRAPFDALVVTRYIHLAQHIATNAPLFRISDFEPLLCPVQIPEKELPELRVGQSAYVTMTAWPDRRFHASVRRIRPVVDASTGTVRVTLEVHTEGDLRPGMFGRVFVEMNRHDKALVIPKAALSLESTGDTVYTVDGGKAERHDVTLGFRDGDDVEVLSGLDEGQKVIVVGQDGLSDGTPVQVLAAGGIPGDGGAEETAGAAPGANAPGARADGSRAGAPGGAGKAGMDPSKMTPEQIEQLKERMRSRGLSEEQIQERLRRMQAQPAE